MKIEPSEESRRLNSVDDVTHPPQLARVAPGDQRASLFAHALTQARLDRAYRLAAVYLHGSSVDAQDAVHDAAVRAWTHWDDLRDPAAFDAWFDRIVLNQCRDRRRQGRRFSLWPLSPRQASDRGTGDSLGALSDSFDNLSPEHRLVIHLRYVEDLPLEAIASRTGTRLGTVKSRLHYGLRQLRSVYEAAERGSVRGG